MENNLKKHLMPMHQIGKKPPCTLGGFGHGRSPAGETHWVIVGVNSFKEAMDIAQFLVILKESMEHLYC